MKTLRPLCALALVAALGAAGCSENSESPTTPQGGVDPVTRTQIETELALATALDEAGTYENALEALLVDPESSPFETAEAIHPVFFFREINRREHTVTIEVEELPEKKVAHVVHQVALGGIFHVIERDTVDGEPVRNDIEKELRDRGRLRARFVKFLGDADETEGEVLERESDGGDARLRWRLAAVSHRRIASPEHTAQIVSVRLQSPSGLDVTITDPLALVRFPLGLPHAMPGERVRVTVQTADPTDEVFLYTRWGRKRLAKTDEGFTGGFLAPERARHFRIGVNALNHETLFDDQAPYDSDFWGLLAWTVPVDLATR